MADQTENQKQTAPAEGFQRSIGKFSSALTLGLNGVIALGGITLAATAAGPVGLALGATTAALAALRLGVGVKSYKDFDKLMDSAKGKTITQLQEESKKRLGILGFMQNPLFQLATSVLTAVAGVALFGTVGPIASLGAVVMAGVGILGVAGVGLAYAIKKTGIDKKLAELEISHDTKAPVQAPANDLSPAAKLDGKAVSADFSAVANENKSELTPSKPDARVKPPQFG